jgi:hypothetical protein
MALDGFAHIGPQFIQRVCLGDDVGSHATSDESPLGRFFNDE